MFRTFLLLCLLGSLNLSGQDPVKRFWSEGPLKLDDFKASSLGDTAHRSEMSFAINYSKVKEKESGRRFTYMKAQAFIYPQESWLQGNIDQERELRYQQLRFNMVELYSRRLQIDLKEKDSDEGFEVAYNYRWNLLQQQLLQLAIDTRKGTHKREMSYWEKRIDQQLKDYPRKRPDLKATSALVIAPRSGIGANFFQGRLNQSFYPQTIFALACDFSYAQYVVDLYLRTGNLSLKAQGLATANNENPNNYLLGHTYGLSIGREIFKRGAHKTSFGLGAEALVIEGNADPEQLTNQVETYTVHSQWGLSTSLHYELNFLRSFSSLGTAFGNDPSFYDHSIHSSLGLSYYPDPKFGGLMLNLTFSYRLGIGKAE